ncbi:hypothetical protein [Paenibacillus polymyxa]|nr:hypothetical protein [Paenibacillus polymyxa]WDZ59479.1 hypothetical protein MF626_07780 [Paenibacillus polymyxa]
MDYKKLTEDLQAAHNAALVAADRIADMAQLTWIKCSLGCREREKLRF